MATVRGRPVVERSARLIGATIGPAGGTALALQIRHYERLRPAVPVLATGVTPADKERPDGLRGARYVASEKSTTPGIGHYGQAPPPTRRCWAAHALPSTCSGLGWCPWPCESPRSTTRSPTSRTTIVLYAHVPEPRNWQRSAASTTPMRRSWRTPPRRYARWDIGHHDRMPPYLVGAIERYCRIRTTLDDDAEEPFSTADDGFLVPPYEAADERPRPGAVVKPHVAAASGSLVLLGEPGVGKTTVFRRLIDAEVAGENPRESVWVEAVALVDSTFQDLIGHHLQIADGPPLTLVIDQLDESPMLGRLPARIRAMSAAAVRPMRLLVACRTAEYPRDLTAVLEELTGSCTVADLAPLTRQQALDLVAGHGYPPEELIHAAVDAGAGALASVPLTLELLGRVFEAHRVLPRRASETFELAAERLAEEPVTGTHATPAQRLAIAGRAATRMLLSGRRTLWNGRALDASPGDLNISALAGGTESVATAAFEVTLPHVGEALRTAVFTGRSDERYAFRHSSIASYLAARHLVDLGVPQPQFRQVLLASNDSVNFSVPLPLRQTATWLVAIDPRSNGWLAAVDPEGLAPYSSVINDDAVRERIVEGLLQRAPSLELSSRAWQRARWNLRHPRLHEQLVTTLTAGSEPLDWDTMARVRLAIRLAEGAQAPELAPALLDVAEGDAWAPHTRRAAAAAAYSCDREQSATRLTSLLARFTELSWAATADPDDELRGELLDLLWPEHITTTEVLGHLHPRRRSNLIGSYAMFLRRFGTTVRREDLAVTLAWALKAIQRRPAQSDVSADDDDPSANVADVDDDTPVGGLDATLVDLLLGSALADESAEELIPLAARLASTRLRRYEPLEMPLAIDDADETAIADPTARHHVRREFALTLAGVSLETGHPADLWQVVSGWRARYGLAQLDEESTKRRATLVDRADFEWLLDRCDVEEGVRRQAAGQLAAFVFDHEDPAAVALAAERVGRPSWEFVGPFFEAIELDSELARILRRSIQPRPVRTWSESPAWHDRVHQVLELLGQGEITPFWQLVRLLQIDPSRGTQYDPEHKDDLFAFPGAVVLTANDRQVVAETMARYILEEHDHSSTWLGTGTWDRRALAGYLALCHEERRGTLGAVNDEALLSWVGSIVWFQPHADEEAYRRRDRLLALVAERCPEQTRDALVTLCRGDLSRGRHVWALHHAALPNDAQIVSAARLVCSEVLQALAPLPRRVDEQQADPTIPDGEVPSEVVLPESPQALSAAVDAWAHLTSFMADADRDAFENLLAEASRSDYGSAASLLGAEAAASALRRDFDRYWPTLRSRLEDSDFGRSVAYRVADSGLSLEGTDEAVIEDVCRWARDLFPPDQDQNTADAHWVSDDESARRWRDSILRVLVDRATASAIAVLNRLAAGDPENLAVRSAVVAAEEAARFRAWRPPTANELMELLVDPRRRLVRSDAELLEVLLETLDAIAADLPTHGELLWNFLRSEPTVEEGVIDQEPWAPKLEASVQSYVAHELRLRLARGGAVVNREVLVTPTSAQGAGTRTDILVEAVNRHGPSGEAIRSSTVIEIKGNWNPELFTGLRDQLVADYLPHLASRAGVYLVGWFPLDQWTVDGSRRRSVPKRAPEEVLAELSIQASATGEERGLALAAVLLEVPRPRRA